MVMLSCLGGQPCELQKNTSCFDGQPCELAKNNTCGNNFAYVFFPVFYALATVLVSIKSLATDKCLFIGDYHKIIIIGATIPPFCRYSTCLWQSL